MRIEIETSNASQSNDLLKSIISDRDQNNLYPGKTKIEFGTQRIQESIDVPEILIFFVSFLATDGLKSAVYDIGINLFSSWLYERLNKSKVKKLRIEEQEVRIEREEIERAISNCETVNITRAVYSFKKSIRTEE